MVSTMLLVLVRAGASCVASGPPRRSVVALRVTVVVPRFAFPMAVVGGRQLRVRRQHDAVGALVVRQPLLVQAAPFRYR